jgi:hypothetical protein
MAEFTGPAESRLSSRQGFLSGAEENSVPVVASNRREQGDGFATIAIYHLL